MVLGNIWKKQKIFFIFALAMLVSGASLDANASSIYVRTIAGQGMMSYSNAVQVVGVQLVGPSEIVVNLSPTSQTVAGQNYSAQLFVNGNLLQTQYVSWTSTELANRVMYQVQFSGLIMPANVSVIDVECQ